MEIRAITPNDFALVAKFLQKEMNPAIPEVRWLQLFHYDWVTPPNWGFAAFTENQIQGFLGCVFGPPPAGSNKLTCNLSNWCVAKSARGTGLGGALFDQYLQENRWHQTLLTAASYLVSTYQGFGFVPYETHRYVFSPKSFPSRVNVWENEEIPLSSLSTVDQKIYLDHQNHRCRFLYCEKNGENCFLVFKDILRKNGTGFFSELLYTNNAEFFLKHPEVLSTLAIRNADSVVAVDRRYFAEAPPEGKVEELYSPRLAKSTESPLPSLHAIYSEVVLMDLKM
jgi:hypothetical protein